MSFVQKIHLAGILITFSFHLIIAQSDAIDTFPPPPPAPPPPTNCIEPEPFFAFQTMPLFPGCKDTTLTNYSDKKDCADKCLFEYVYKNLDIIVLPPDADPGTIIVGFTVEMDGAVSDIEIIRSNGTDVDQRILNIIKQMPKWEPGRQRGRPVRTKFYLPIRICLE